MFPNRKCMPEKHLGQSIWCKSALSPLLFGKELTNGPGGEPCQKRFSSPTWRPPSIPEDKEQHRAHLVAAPFSDDGRISPKSMPRWFNLLPASRKINAARAEVFDRLFASWLVELNQCVNYWSFNRAFVSFRACDKTSLQSWLRLNNLSPSSLAESLHVVANVGLTSSV